MATNELIAENFAPPQWCSWSRNSFRVVDWNIDRGLKLPSAISFLSDVNADIVLLQEVDLNAHRTHQLNVAREIAKKLRLNYVFGREFIELTQGTKANPAYHGQATLSRWKISNARIIRFQQQSDFWKPRWFKPNLRSFQERLGGRIALAAEINIGSVSILCYNLHLESRGHDELRLAQFDEVLHDAATYGSAIPVIVAGDLNLDASKAGISLRLNRAGFLFAVPTTRQPTTPGRHLLEVGRQIDWAFVRNALEATNGMVHSSIKSSDHYPISFDLTI